jgi:hypothetical protein
MGRDPTTDLGWTFHCLVLMNEKELGVWDDEKGGIRSHGGGSG